MNPEYQQHCRSITIDLLNTLNKKGSKSSNLHRIRDRIADDADMLEFFNLAIKHQVAAEQQVIDEVMAVLQTEGSRSPKLEGLCDKIRHDPELLEVFTAAVVLRRVYEQDPNPGNLAQLEAPMIGGKINFASLFLGIALGMMIIIPYFVFVESKLRQEVKELQAIILKQELGIDP